ncbi:hypothetical protein BCR44DRAFT_1260804 [Catenaria anguillulae PL171]|uniref:Uncharacterized protein n=1 Tax=Catenaria anguillulae PL171 TaxID=765915 RepID=A0A1Y2HB27_9FUNG|nr:hypothetical protein BCR44DRAFT_1260804 [Catenaria anguillulae PL171]
MPTLTARSTSRFLALISTSALLRPAFSCQVWRTLAAKVRRIRRQELPDRRRRVPLPSAGRAEPINVHFLAAPTFSPLNAVGEHAQAALSATIQEPNVTHGHIEVFFGPYFNVTHSQPTQNKDQFFKFKLAGSLAAARPQPN